MYLPSKLWPTKNWGIEEKRREERSTFYHGRFGGYTCWHGHVPRVLFGRYWRLGHSVVPLDRGTPRACSHLSLSAVPDFTCSCRSHCCSQYHVPPGSHLIAIAPWFVDAIPLKFVAFWILTLSNFRCGNLLKKNSIHLYPDKIIF